MGPIGRGALPAAVEGAGDEGRGEAVAKRGEEGWEDGLDEWRRGEEGAKPGRGDGSREPSYPSFLMRETDLLVGGAEERGLLEADVSPDEEHLLMDCCDLCCSAATRCLVGPAMVEGVGE